MGAHQQRELEVGCKVIRRDRAWPVFASLAQHDARRDKQQRVFH